MKVKVPQGFPGRVDFIKSAAKLSQSPHHAMPEICVCGRSNVGKSSMLNTICNRRQMARVSSTPGRTQLINFFNVQDRLVLVDLPGYGWAKVPKSVKRQWGPALEQYLDERPQLVLALCLVDMRRDPGQEEKGLLAWFQQKKLPVIVVATKSDKVAKSKRLNRVNNIAKELQVHPKSVVQFSSLKGDGKELLWGQLLAYAGKYDTEVRVDDE
jgi:GTP-binding protein